MRKIVLAALLLAAAAVASAQEIKPKVTLGGLFFFNAHYDTYKSVDNRQGVSYSYPLAPDYDPSGEDLNKVGQFGVSVYQTRLNVTVTGVDLLNASGRLYVETDFMGSSKDYLQMLRLRHAYFQLDWKHSSLLLGQTDNLEMPSEVLPWVFTAGGGSPIRVLSRPVQVRYGQDLAPLTRLYVALSYHAAGPVPGEVTLPATLEAQRNSGVPSIDARLQWGDPNKLFVGLGGAFKALRPRIKTLDGERASTISPSANVTAFLRYNYRGYGFRAQALYGGNVTNLAMPGAYGKLLSDDLDADYGYTNMRTLSLWADFETKSFKGYSFGCFGGYVKNDGFADPVDTRVIYGRDPKLGHTGRVSPRVTYTFSPAAMCGLEYSLYWSSWGKSFDDHYRPTESWETTYNNRITFLFRYRF